MNVYSDDSYGTKTSWDDLSLMLGMDKARLLNVLSATGRELHLNDGSCDEYDRFCFNKICGPLELIGELPINTTDEVRSVRFDNRGQSKETLTSVYTESWTTATDHSVKVTDPAAVHLDGVFHFDAFSVGPVVTLTNTKGCTKSQHQEYKCRVQQTISVPPGKYLELALQKKITGKVRRFRIPVAVTGWIGITGGQSLGHCDGFYPIEMVRGPLISHIVLVACNADTTFEVMARTEPGGPLQPYNLVKEAVVQSEEDAVAKAVPPSTAGIFQDRVERLGAQVASKVPALQGRGTGKLTGVGKYIWVGMWATPAIVTIGATALVSIMNSDHKDYQVGFKVNGPGGLSAEIWASSVAPRDVETRALWDAIHKLPADQRPTNVKDKPSLIGSFLSFVDIE